ncbi:MULTISPECIES: hypothetical protein [Lysinibacillus]|uniref:hypothetical protein n=1 Tax=Lysinibacillus TaxID=400634 RepID=UPI00083CA1B2|nr:hypothetical protein [Lysinibacillus xylanilyticus]
MSRSIEMIQRSGIQTPVLKDENQLDPNLVSTMTVVVRLITRQELEFSVWYRVTPKLAMADYLKTASFTR